MIQVDPEVDVAMPIHASGWSAAKGRVAVWVVLASTIMSACSSKDPEPAPIESPPPQRVSIAEIERLLDEGDLANQQLADQLARITRPYGGYIDMDLNLADTTITDEEFKSLTLPDNLTRVDLTRTRITDDGIAHLVTGKNIVELKLVSTRITPEGLVHLRAMPRLRTVHLHSTDIPAKEQVELQKFLRNRPPNE